MSLENEKIFSPELKKVLHLMERDILDEYPSNKLTIEHFIVSIFNSRGCNVYSIIKKLIDNKSIDELYDFCSDKLLENSRKIINIKKKASIGYDVILGSSIVDAERERDKLNETQISSEHVILAILSKKKSPISAVLEKIGLDYNLVFNHINNKKFEDDEKTKEDVSKEKQSSNQTIIKKNTTKSVIESYCVNLNKLSRDGKIDKLIGRDSEVKNIIKILGRRSKQNVILCGLPGVGKSAIVSGLANMIESNDGMFLNGKTILSLDMASIVAGTMYRGDLEGRFNNLLSEIKQSKEYVLFIDDIHNVLDPKSNTTTDIAGIISNALSDGDIQIIATTSFKGYKTSIESDSNLSRKFQKITINPTTIEETEKILFSSKKYYEDYHNVEYSDDAIKACVFLANKYITDRQMPDSAIDIMDECGADKKVNLTIDTKLPDLKKDLKLNEDMYTKSMRANDFALADEYSNKIKELKGDIINEEKKQKQNKKKNVIKISDNDIYNVFSESIGIPISKLSNSEKTKYKNIDKVLSECVIGQEEAILKISQSVKRSRLGLDRKNKPNSVFLFSGVSGVGKTLIAKKLAEEIYGGDNYLVRFDMSEYADKTSVNKIFGSSAGYVGFEQGGLLTEAIKNKKHCVLLLDEIEKADKEILNVFLQVFDDGVLTDNTGYKVSFKNVTIIMTSNIGAREAASIGGGIGFQTNIEEKKKDVTQKALKQHFPPEFLNRLDAIIHFNNLDDNNLKKIFELELKTLNKSLNELNGSNFSIEYTPEVVEYLFNKMKNDNNGINIGARPISRIIRSEIVDIISDLYLDNDYDNGYTFKSFVENNKLIIK